MVLSSTSVLAATAAAKSLQSCPTLCDPIDSSPTKFRCPPDSPGKNTGVGCHFLLQFMKVKSESEVAQTSPTLSNPMDCSLQDSSTHGIFQARVLEWGDIAFSGTLSYQDINDLDIQIHCIIKSPIWIALHYISFSSVQFSRSVVSDSATP